MPHSRAGKALNAIEEERRLLYVAMTRAKQQLTLLMPLSSTYAKLTVRPLGDRKPIIARTRFIPDACLRRFKCKKQGGSTPTQMSRALNG